MISLRVFKGLLILFLNFFHNVGFNRVIYLDVIVSINHESTFTAVGNFLNIILEVLEAGWGGNIEQRMASKYAAFQGQPAPPPPLDPSA